MADFDIPVDDFEALRSMVEAGDLPAAAKRFQELTRVSLKDAQFFVEEMAAGNSSAKSISEPQDTSAAGQGPADPEPAYTSIPLPVSRSRSTASTSRPAVPKPVSADLKVSTPEPEPAKPTPTPTPTPTPKVSSASAPVKPPATKPAMTMPGPGPAGGVDIDGKAVVSGRGRLRWYEWGLPLFAIPLLFGGPVGGLFCVLAFAAVLMILKSSTRHRARRCVGAIMALAGSYAGYLAVVGEVPRQLSLPGVNWQWQFAGPAPIEPSSTHDWHSPADFAAAGAVTELQAILDHSYRPPPAFPPASSVIKNSTLTVQSEDRPVGGALVGVPLLEKKRDLVADFGRGTDVTLVSCVLRFPRDKPGASPTNIDGEESASQAAASVADLPVSNDRKRPLLRCTVRFNRTSSEELEFHLFDARSGRKVSSAKSSRAGQVDFDLAIWHQTPLLMIVEANAYASSPGWRRPLPVGEDFALGLGRAQVAYVGPGRLDGVANGATIECGKPYRLVDAEKPRSGGMVIVRYAPPYLAGSTSLLMEATSDHLVSVIPAFDDFEYVPVGADGDRLGFRVFHIPPTIDDRLQGQGLQLGSTRESRARADDPKIERAVNFASDRLSVMFDSQRGRGLIAVDEVEAMLPTPESGNLFDLKIPLVAFEKDDTHRQLLEFAVDAVQFDLQQADREPKWRDFPESIEYRDLTPRQALLDFEQLTGVRVIVDSEQRFIRLQR